MVFVYTTIGTKQEAKELSRKLVKAKLAACVNYWSVESVYEWKGKMVNEKEYVLLIKTAKKRFKDVSDFIRKHHSYELPCIVELPITDSLREYQQWAMGSVKGV